MKTKKTLMISTVLFLFGVIFFTINSNGNVKKVEANKDSTCVRVYYSEDKCKIDPISKLTEEEKKEIENDVEKRENYIIEQNDLEKEKKKLKKDRNKIKKQIEAERRNRSYNYYNLKTKQKELENIEQEIIRLGKKIKNIKKYVKNIEKKRKYSCTERDTDGKQTCFGKSPVVRKKKRSCYRSKRYYNGTPSCSLVRIDNKEPTGDVGAK